ncbi:MAG: hypothetical protein N2C14_06125, partial [Planctomycetales bacterium]
MSTVQASPRSSSETATTAGRSARDEAVRRQYWETAKSYLPRLLGAIDRNPFRPTHGCLDREFWHYRTSDFPCGMHQEAVLPLALAWAKPFPNNPWQGQERLRDLGIAALRFSARGSHRDGSCDDYYPFERALGAAVFSLTASAEAYRLFQLEDAETLAWLERRATWLSKHDETGRLANHQALAALALQRAAEVTGNDRFAAAARTRVEQALSWQSSEGWFEEYGGADPGYQTVTIDALAKYRRMTRADALDEPLARAVGFARRFLHPDDSYGGESGSRGTYHFYPHGMELLAEKNASAADLADGFLRSLRRGTNAFFDDDRMYAHRLGNLMEAYLDWSPSRPAADSSADANHGGFTYLPKAGMLIHREKHDHPTRLDSADDA